MNKNIQVGTIIKINTLELDITFKVEKIEIRHTQLFQSEWEAWVIGKHADHNYGDITPNFNISLNDLVSSLKRYQSANATNKIEFQQPETD